MVSVKTHGPKSAIESSRNSFLVCGGFSRDLITLPSTAPSFRSVCDIHRGSTSLVDAVPLDDDVFEVNLRCNSLSPVSDFEL